MNRNQTDPLAVDLLFALARMVLANTPRPTAAATQALATHTGLPEEDIRAALWAAQAIVANHQAGQSSLERDLEDPNTYRIRPEASVYIEVEDPQRPGYGYGVSIHADSDGPGIETWPYGPNETPQDPDREPEPLDRIDWAFDVVDALLTEEANA